VIRDSDGRVSDLLAQAISAGYLAGIPLGQWYPHLDDCFLVAVTEKRTKAEIDGLAEILSARRETAAPRPHTRLASVAL
jgi:glycine dehydrogenase subunit 1